MNTDKQAIEEMAKVFCETCLSKKYCELPTACCHQAYFEAEHLYKAGYRKQSEGEWKVTRSAKRIYIKCLCCNYTKLFDRLESITDEKRYIIDDFIKEHRFCPNCGAKMKGGVEG